MTSPTTRAGKYQVIPVDLTLPHNWLQFSVNALLGWGTLIEKHMKLERVKTTKRALYRFYFIWTIKKLNA